MTIGTYGATKPYPNAIHQDSLQIGAEFLDFVLVALQRRGLYLQPFTSKKYQYHKGESFQGWEVKLDNPFLQTKRLSIEIAEKTKATNAVWVDSGIYRSDNTWLYIQGNYQCFYIFIKKHLVSLHKSGRYEIAESYGTVRKFYLPISDADKYGEKIIPTD